MAGLIELEGDSIRSLGTDDLPALMRLRETIPDELFHLPGTATELTGFLGFLANKPWSLPMMCGRHGTPFGLCLLNVQQLKHLNAYLVALFETPATAHRSLALYIRQVFWFYPLHRLYAQLPSLPEMQPHIDLLAGVGFQREGVLAGHAEVGGRPVDVVVLGLLRDEFDVWCATNDPRLSLA